MVGIYAYKDPNNIQYRIENKSFQEVKNYKIFFDTCTYLFLVPNFVTSRYTLPLWSWLLGGRFQGCVKLSH